MTKLESYQCNLCRRPLAWVLEEGFPAGWALTWCGSLLRPPESGSRLEQERRWDESEIHLCQVCVIAIGEFRESARRIRQLNLDYENATQELFDECEESSE